MMTVAWPAIRWYLLVLAGVLLLAACGPVATAPDTLRPAGDGPRLLPTATSATVAGPAHLPPGGHAISPLLPVFKLELIWSLATGPVGHPIALAVGPDRLYIVDVASHQLVVVDPDGHILARWGSEGSDAGQFRFRRPAGCCAPTVGGGVAVDAAHHVYIADYANHRIQKFDPQGRFLTSWGRHGRAAGHFDLPAAIAVDRDGRVYVSDSDNHRIQVFDEAGTFLTQWGPLGVEAGQFLRPGGVAVDGRGQVYVQVSVADPGHQAIQVFDRHGRRLARRSSTMPSERGMPGSLAVDAAGHLYLIDGRRIQECDQQGQLLAYWDSDWQDDGHLSNPSGLAIDAAGAVYVADQGSQRLVKYRQLLPTTS